MPPLLALAAVLHVLAAGKARQSPPTVGHFVSPAYSQERLAWLATHEAGHTIAAWCCPFVGIVKSVAIKPVSDGPVLWTGVTQHDWIIDPGTAEYLWWDMLISLAGLAAEVATYGQVLTLPPRLDIDDALTSVRALCRTRGCFSGVAPQLPIAVPCSPSESAALGYAWGKASELLATHRRAHSLLTQALIVNKRLSASDLLGLLGPRNGSPQRLT